MTGTTITPKDRAKRELIKSLPLGGGATTASPTPASARWFGLEAGPCLGGRGVRIGRWARANAWIAIRDSVRRAGGHSVSCHRHTLCRQERPCDLS